MNIKDNVLKQMVDFSNWKEITNGLYCFEIDTFCYEIHINYYRKGDAVLKATASLFLSGDWHSKTWYRNREVYFFQRECLLEEQTVAECLKKAIQHFKENAIMIEEKDKI